jgi:hypothetical protein
MSHTSVAVVGGGIFGATSAVELARHGFDVTLFEQKSHLFAEASGHNQNRLHLGYHYPRAPVTVRQLKNSFSSFMEEYSSAVIYDSISYYAIARQNSRTSPEAFLMFCRMMDLEYRITETELLNPNQIDLCVEVPEPIIDPDKLRKICESNLRAEGVKVFLNTIASSVTLARFDAIVIATYARINELLVGLGCSTKLYQFEVCEKPLVKLPSALRGRSIVILDGSFMCLDPIGNSELSQLGNVRQAIHAANVGLFPEIPEELHSMVNNGLIVDFNKSRFMSFIHDAKKFIRNIDRTEHCGSRLTVRCVIPHLEKTDERPTVLTRHSSNVFSVWSGKMVTSVAAARQMARAIAGDCV